MMAGADGRAAAVTVHIKSDVPISQIDRETLEALSVLVAAACEAIESGDLAIGHNQEQSGSTQEWSRCSACNGTGEWPPGVDCPVCDGEGGWWVEISRNESHDKQSDTGPCS